MDMQMVHIAAMTNRIREFGSELKRVCDSGHVVRMKNIHTTDDHPVKGIEVFLDMRTSKTQVRHIVAYVVKRYNFDAFFYTKTHSIKVWYRNAK